VVAVSSIFCYIARLKRSTQTTTPQLDSEMYICVSAKGINIVQVAFFMAGRDR